MRTTSLEILVPICSALLFMILPWDVTADITIYLNLRLDGIKARRMNSTGGLELQNPGRPALVVNAEYTEKKTADATKSREIVSVTTNSPPAPHSSVPWTQQVPGSHSSASSTTQTSSSTKQVDRERSTSQNISPVPLVPSTTALDPLFCEQCGEGNFDGFVISHGVNCGRLGSRLPPTRCPSGTDRCMWFEAITFWGAGDIEEILQFRTCAVLREVLKQDPALKDDECVEKEEDLKDDRWKRRRWCINKDDKLLDRK